MTKNHTRADKNLQNVADELAQSPVNSHQAQQVQQQKNDRRKQDQQNRDKYDQSLS